MRIDAITATLNASAGDTPLPLIAGSITLDATRAPYAQGSLTIPLPNADVLDALNPMDEPRVTITASVADTSRTFDLRLQARSFDAANDTATLTIESDEGALMNLVLTPETTPPPLLPDPLAAVARVQAQIDALALVATKDRVRNQMATAATVAALDALVPEVESHTEALKPQRLAASISAANFNSSLRGAS